MNGMGSFMIFPGTSYTSESSDFLSTLYFGENDIAGIRSTAFVRCFWHYKACQPQQPRRLVVGRLHPLFHPNFQFMAVESFKSIAWRLSSLEDVLLPRVPVGSSFSPDT
jgi:hypothetical protein